MRFVCNNIHCIDYVLNGYHGYIHRGYIVNGVTYQTCLVKQTLRVSHVVTYLYAPGEKENFTLKQNRLSITHSKSESPAEKDRDCFRIFTDSQAVIPPVVRTLVELQVVIIRDYLGVRRRADGPRSEINQHHQQNGHHPLQQLFVRQLNLMGALHPVCKRNPAGKHIYSLSPPLRVRPSYETSVEDANRPSPTYLSRCSILSLISLGKVVIRNRESLYFHHGKRSRLAFISFSPQFNQTTPHVLSTALIEAAYRQVFINNAVYETQNPICLVHFVAMHEYISRTGNIAAIYGQELLISMLV